MGWRLSLVALRWPALLPIMAGLAVVVALALWWRSRASFGARTEVPPGRIHLHSLALFEDESHLRQLAERYGPIFKIGATFPVPTFTPIICVVGHDLGLELLRNHEASLEFFPPFPVSRLIPRGFMRDMTVADHERYAPLFRHAMATCADAEFKRAVAVSAREALARMANDSAGDPDLGLSPRPYLRDFAFDVLARLHFGFASGSEEQAQLAAEFSALGIAQFWRLSPEVARRDRWATTVDRVEAECGRPRAVSSVLGTVLEAKPHGDEHDPATVVGNVLQMQESGTEDLSSLLVWVVKHLGDHSEWLDQLALEIPAPGQRPLGERIIRESLRLEQSEYLYRRATNDIGFHGYRIPKGWRIRICIREAHRDPAIFSRPSEFNPDRFVDQSYPVQSFAPFGLFRHRCVGAQVSYLVGRIFVEEMARAYRLTIIDDGPRQHGRFHWQPSPRLRVRLDPPLALG